MYKIDIDEYFNSLSQLRRGCRENLHLVENEIKRRQEINASQQSLHLKQLNERKLHLKLIETTISTLAKDIDKLCIVSQKHTNIFDLSQTLTKKYVCAFDNRWKNIINGNQNMERCLSHAMDELYHKMEEHVSKHEARLSDGQRDFYAEISNAMSKKLRKPRKAITLAPKPKSSPIKVIKDMLSSPFKKKRPKKSVNNSPSMQRIQASNPTTPSSRPQHAGFKSV